MSDFTAQDYKTACNDHNGSTLGEPGGYQAWHCWAEKQGKTHKQVKCDECGLFKIWVEKE